MVVTRARSGAAPKQVDADVVLQQAFSGQSLLAWASGSRKKKPSGTVRKPQTNAPILNLPLDLLAIIFSFCQPSDLLQICRTCHDFKAFFLSQASLPIWQASRRLLSFSITEEDAMMLQEWEAPQAGTFRLPDCPSFLSQPAYAAFLCEPGCMYCHAKDGGMRPTAIRVCWECRQSRLFVSSKALKAEWKQDADPRLFTILPNIADEYSSRKPRANDPVYHQPTCKAIFDRAFEYEVETKFNARLMNAFFAKGEQELKEREAFAKAYSAFIAAESKLALIGEYKKVREREERYKRNETFVVMRLEMEGIDSFETDIDDTPGASRLIRTQQHDMDDAIYATLRSTLIEYLKPVQEQRRFMTAYYDPENTRIRDLLNECLEALSMDPNALPVPMRLADFIELPSCKKLSNAQSFINGDESDRQASWNAVRDNVVNDIAAWILAKQQDIIGILEHEKALMRADGILPERVDDIELSPELLQKPFTQLVCNGCSFGLGSNASEMLGHDCFAAYSPYNLNHTRRRLRDAGVNTQDMLAAPLVFKKESLSIEWERTLTGQAIYDAIVKVGGEPPNTLAALKNKKGTLRCAQCDEGSPERDGTTVALSYIAHWGEYSFSTPKLHNSFTYVLPAGGLEADFNDDSPPLQHSGWAGPDLYDSDEMSDDYWDYMHGGMMGDIDADMMMDAMMGGGLSDDDW